MTLPNDSDASLCGFSGIAPLFPLPNVGLFPHALLPLHIFEPRYRKMTADALKGDKLIAMGLLQEGWQQIPSYCHPAVHRMVGLGKIIAHEQLEDGRYYLVLRGVSRARLITETPSHEPYRVGQLELCPDPTDDYSSFSQSIRSEELLTQFARIFPQINLQKLFLHSATELPLATVCDVLLGSMPLPPELLQTFLEECDPEVRGQMLMDLMDQPLFEINDPSIRKFPPVFSLN